MIGTLLRDKDNNILAPVSQYQPPQDVGELSHMVQTDNVVGYNLQYEPFTEFNDLSLLQRADKDQKRWNAYRAPGSEDVDEMWRYNGIRPITRNRILGIVAQMTANLVIPAPFAQNDKDEIDRAAALVMRDLMEYNIRNSSYVENYISWITDSLVNPIAYFGVGFFEAMQTVKEDNEGKISKKEVIDSVLSGFQTFNIPIDEVLIGNFYQKQLDRQRFVIRRRYIEYDEAKAIWGENDNFEFVRPGIRTTFNTETSLFYDAFDEDLKTIAEELTYYNRQEDIEVPFVNGVYMGDDDVEDNMIKHRDNENKPKYNFAGLGYEDISTRFFFYKSAAWKLGDDDELVIRMEQLTVDATFLSVMPPTITAGHGQLSEAIVIPGKNTAFENPDVTVTPIQLGSALQAGWSAVFKKEQDMNESTQDPLMTGTQSGAQKTAREAILLAQNAKIALGRFGNMFVNSLKQFGGLMIDVIIQHQTVGDVDAVTDKQTFKTFILSDVEMDGQTVTKKIIFTPGLGEMDEDMEMERSVSILEKEGGVDSDMRIYEVDPNIWRRLKYYLYIDVKELVPPILMEMADAERQAMLQQTQKVV